MATVKLEKGDENNIFIVDVDGEKHGIPWDELLKYWQSADKRKINGMGAFVQGPGVVGWLTYPNGVKGAIFVWDTVAKRMVHVSEGSFTRKALLYGNMIFSLREIPKQDTSDLMLCFTPVNTLDAENKKLVNAANLGITIFDRKFNIENYKLAVKDRTVFAGFRNNVKQIKLVTPEEAKAQQEAKQKADASNAKIESSES